MKKGSESRHFNPFCLGTILSSYGFRLCVFFAPRCNFHVLAKLDIRACLKIIGDLKNLTVSHRFPYWNCHFGVLHPIFRHTTASFPRHVSLLLLAPQLSDVANPTRPTRFAAFRASSDHRQKTLRRPSLTFTEWTWGRPSFGGFSMDVPRKISSMLENPSKKNGWYPLVMTNSLLTWKWTFRFLVRWFTELKDGDFPVRYVNVYQRVSHGWMVGMLMSSIRRDVWKWLVVKYTSQMSSDEQWLRSTPLLMTLLIVRSVLYSCYWCLLEILIIHENPILSRIGQRTLRPWATNMSTPGIFLIPSGAIWQWGISYGDWF